MQSSPIIVPEITHLQIRDLDGSTSALPLGAMVIVDDPKVLIHLRQERGHLLLECSRRLLVSPESQIESLTLLNDGAGEGDSKSLLITCNDGVVSIPITRLTKLLNTPPEFKVGILADPDAKKLTCSIAYSSAFTSDIEQLDSVILL